jgi:carbon storage regulator CsrA
MICVLGMTTGQVKIGIEAPADVRILRQELIDRELEYQKKIEPVKLKKMLVERVNEKSNVGLGKSG